MDFFSALTLFGGLAMFLYGMRLMGDALKESSSGTLKVAIEHVTDNPVKAFILGVAITAVIQSSTATIVITSGLVGAGILSLHQSLGIIIGANVGTTVTGQIIRLLDVNAGSSSILRLFQPSSLAPIALILGIILIMGFSGKKNYRSIGNIAIGFGILFSGLLNMTSAVKSIQESGLIETLFTGLGNNPFIGYVTGAGVAFVLQSSSATIGILQAFSTTGLLVWKAIYPVIVGIYLGDCVTTAIVCSIGAEKEAQRVGIVNICFNLSETVLVLVACSIVHRLGLIDTLWETTVNSGIIANTNTLFNLGCSILLFPLLGVYEKISRKIIRDDKVSADPYRETIDALSPTFFSTPALALNSCYECLLTMFSISKKGILSAMPLMDTFDRKTCDNILANEFEHLGDFAEDIAQNASNLAENGIHFSEQATKEIQVMNSLIEELLEETEGAFSKRNVEKSYRVEALTQVAEQLISMLKDHHLKRLGDSTCSTQADVNFVNLLTQFERICDSCSNIGAAVIIRTQPELAEKEHIYYHDLRKGRMEDFRALLEQVQGEYMEKLTKALS